MEWKGPKANNNGKISLSVRQAAECMGVSNDTAAKAFHELQAKGFIVVIQPASLGVYGKGKCPEYEITEIARPPNRDGRCLFGDWTRLIVTSLLLRRMHQTEKQNPVLIILTLLS